MALTAACVGLALMGMAGQTSAAVVTSFFDDFEAEPYGIPHSDFAQWVVNDGSVDTVGPVPAGFDVDCQGSNVCVDLDGTNTSGAPTLVTKDSFAVGTYKLSFDLGSQFTNPGDTVTISLGDYSETFSVPGVLWQTFMRTVSVSTTSPSAELRFVHSATDNNGIKLDNVSVSAVPLPAALPLFLTMLAGMGLLRWWKRRVA
ncbi:MAG: VPLPA-CTERM sorting domain-containing protein [Alphaproteobacteria bacterium]|nr:VPLPA-CTERM sorting domain-containing protein [Alphaproteobacteria bacterium]